MASFKQMIRHLVKLKLMLLLLRHVQFTRNVAFLLMACLIMSTRPENKLFLSLYIPHLTIRHAKNPAFFVVINAEPQLLFKGKYGSKTVFSVRLFGGKENCFSVCQVSNCWQSFLGFLVRFKRFRRWLKEDDSVLRLKLAAWKSFRDRREEWLSYQQSEAPRRNT